MMGPAVQLWFAVAKESMKGTAARTKQLHGPHWFSSVWAGPNT